MLRVTGRYDRPVDGGPANQGFAEAGDVPCRVEVGIERAAADGAPERVPLPYPDIPAPRAHLAGVLRWDRDYLLPAFLGLVAQKSLELSEGPPAKLAVELPPQSLVLPDAQVLHGQNIEVRSDYFFSDTMVDVCLKPSLPSREALEVPLCRAGACRLQLASKICVATPDIPKMLGVEESAIGCDGDVVDASIDANDPWIRDISDRNIGQLDHQIGHQIMVDIPDPERLDLATGVFPEVLGNAKRNLESPLNGGQRQGSAVEEGFERPLVEPCRAVWFLEWPSPAPLPFQHVSGTVSCSLDERGLKRRPLVAGCVVSERLELPLGMRPVVEAQSEEEVRGFVEDADCLPNGFGWFQPNGYGSVHEQIGCHMAYMGFCGTMVKVECGARDHLTHHLVPEVPQGTARGSSEEPENRDDCDSGVSGIGS